MFIQIIEIELSQFVKKEEEEKEKEVKKEAVDINEEKELVRNVEIQMKRISDRLFKCLEWEKENTELKNKMHNIEKMNELFQKEF